MSMLDQMWRGGRALTRGFRFLAAHRTLWPWALIPFLIQLIVLVILFSLFIENFPAVYKWLTPFLGKVPDVSDAGFWQTILGWLLRLAHAILQLFLALLGALILLLLSFVVGLIISGPFNDILSEKTESLVKSQVAVPSISIWKSIVRSVVVESQKALFFLGIPLVLLVLHLIPVVGSLLYFVLTGLFEMWAAGFSFADYPLGRRDVSFRERIHFARQHASALTGLGIAFWVPGMLIVCASPLVVAGTLLYVELQQDDMKKV